ncbi:transporter substrate-binding domain-containing protein [Lentibacillus sp. Marseille-P4043]|uniref:transporter substrate-binding domain-containing protein n=1 Tax=Lentibacillus sp. Marseille-P4043 TaxID=2040293 RepID=UPI000D0B81F6|nr:transporter substrate-binding domain-containing protein [Lentibacillus sp. Marseille-P4043]
MRLKVGALLLTLLFLLVACGEASEQGEKGDREKADGKWTEIKDAGELVVGTPGTLYPASYYPEGSDELTGYDVEVIREIAKRLDLDVTFETLSFDAMFASLKSGRIDVVQAGLRENNKKKFAFSDPYKYSYSTMIVRKDEVSEFTSLEDLKGKKAGGAATTVYSDIARKFGAEVKTYGNVTNDVYLRDVDNGRTDVIINDYYLQSLALEAFPDLNISIQPDLKFYPTTQNVVLEKDADTLKKKVNEALTDMREDGTLTKLSKEFFGGKDVSKQPDEEIIEIEGIE